jgi:hypothetical protein
MDRNESELIDGTGEIVVNQEPEATLPAVEPVAAVHTAPTPAPRVTPAGELRDASPERIRGEIERTRAAMDVTLDRLSARMRPRHLVDDVMRFFEQQGSEDEGSARRTVRETGEMALGKIKSNPVPATLIGAGLAWLLFKDNRSARTVRTTAEPSLDPYADSATEGYLDAGASSGAGSATGEMKGRASSGMHSVTATAERSGARAKQALAGAVESAPLALGVGALAAGLLAGLVLPGTRTEDELIGGAAENIKSAARETATAIRDEVQHSTSSPSRWSSKVDRMLDR